MPAASHCLLWGWGLGGAGGWGQVTREAAKIDMSIMVSASLSTRQTWTALQHDGTNHLELWLNQEYIKDGPDPLNVAVPATNTHSPHPAMVLQSTAPPPLHHLNHLHPRRRRRR